jgi:glycine hydroxymethyltransferase
VATQLKEVASPAFKAYAGAVRGNARALAGALVARGHRLATGGTDNHLLLCDLTPKGVPGKVAAQALDRAGIVCNYNSIPFDPRKPFDPSGIRLGTPAITSRGMGPAEMARIGDWIADVVENVGDEARIASIQSHCASTSSRRTNSVWSPSIRSSSRRS